VSSTASRLFDADRGLLRQARRDYDTQQIAAQTVEEIARVQAAALRMASARENNDLLVPFAQPHCRFTEVADSWLLDAL